MVVLSQLGQQPGIYREEVFLTPRPELATGVPVFFGYGQAGPFNTPQKLTLWPQFAAMFGAAVEGGYWADAVHGFFSNGGEGSFCYGVRLQSDDISPEHALQAGLLAVEALEDVDLICVPDIGITAAGKARDAERVLQLQIKVLESCDRTQSIAILDTFDTADVDQLRQQRQRLVSSPSGINGALYGPWIISERRQMQGDGRKRVPPCGHVAGVYRKCDRAEGVHQAPANIPLTDILDIDSRFARIDPGAINPPTELPNINLIRLLPGRGLRIWGAYTLSQDPLWHYINVRRLTLTVGRWAEQNLRDVAFEPNDFRLWVRIERELGAYLETLSQAGALQGSTPKEAFFVRCNAQTNPPAVRAAGQIITEVGIAAARPNEFIVVRLVHGSSGVLLNSAGNNST